MCKNKLAIVSLLLPLVLLGNPFEQNCQECHIAKKQMEMFMSRYVLKYSSQNKVKKAIFHYLKNPKEENSVMPMGFLNRFGVKEKSTLSDKELQEAIEIYYKNYAPKFQL